MGKKVQGCLSDLQLHHGGGRIFHFSGDDGLSSSLSAIMGGDSQAALINSERSSRSSAPKDPGHLVYFIFYWLGMGSLLPWNFFIAGDRFGLNSDANCGSQSSFSEWILDA